MFRLTNEKVQVQMSDQMQLGDILSEILKTTGPANLTVSTFSTGEEFLRNLLRLKNKGLVTSAVLYCDMKAAEKTARINTMLRNTFDKVMLCRNHSKVLLILTNTQKISVITSQNQTRGNRMESYVVLQDNSIYDYLFSSIQKMNCAEIWTEQKI
jgi:hypothetical protein